MMNFLIVFYCYKLVVFLQCKLPVSKAEVASSKSKIFGFLTRALAIATRCFCPFDSLSPFVPTLVS